MEELITQNVQRFMSWIKFPKLFDTWKWGDELPPGDLRDIVRLVTMNNHQVIVVACNSQEEGSAILQMVAKGVESLPVWFRPIMTWHAGDQIEFENGMRVRVCRYDKNRDIRGFAITYLFLVRPQDSKEEDLKDFMGCIYPTIASGRHSKVFCTSRTIPPG